MSASIRYQINYPQVWRGKKSSKLFRSFKYNTIGVCSFLQCVSHLNHQAHLIKSVRSVPAIRFQLPRPITWRAFFTKWSYSKLNLIFLRESACSWFHSCVIRNMRSFFKSDQLINTFFILVNWYASWKIKKYFLYILFLWKNIVYTSLAQQIISHLLNNCYVS